jgi:hypothetical protein
MSQRVEDVTPHALLLARTGRALFDSGSSEELRLALVVLDGLAEMLLRFNTAECETWFELGRAGHDVVERAATQGVEVDLVVHQLTFPVTTTMAELGQTVPVHLSRSQRKRLFEFDSNVDVAVFFGVVSRMEAATLKSLHHYRNRAYHHNDARAGTLHGLVDVQLHVLARLATAIRPLVSGPIASSTGVVPPTLREVGDALSTGSPPDAGALITSLRAALHEQMDALDRRVREIVQFINRPFELVSYDDVLRLVQLPEPWPPLDEVREAAVPTTPETVERWRSELDAVGGSGEPIAAVADYFRVEKPLARLMEEVTATSKDVDRAVDREMDLRRGR